MLSVPGRRNANLCVNFFLQRKGAIPYYGHWFWQIHRRAAASPPCLDSCRSWQTQDDLQIPTEHSNTAACAVCTISKHHCLHMAVFQCISGQGTFDVQVRISTLTLTSNSASNWYERICTRYVCCQDQSVYNCGEQSV